MAGGGSSSSDLLAGLQQLCGNYKSQSEDTKDGSEPLIMALENLLARARRQKGFDLFNGLRRQLAEKEQRSRAQASNSSWSSSWDDKRQRQWKDYPSSGQTWRSWRHDPAQKWLGQHRAKNQEPYKDDWGNVVWRPRLADWGSAETSKLHMVCGAVDFAKVLDDFKDEGFVVLADSIETTRNAVDWHVVNAMLGSLLLPTNVPWPEDPR
ncbi:unnamed protein product [Effrenium voratum]|uniref:Uncharacterized protein n=1 Tax=Effrenium voratum TaxID=2562239 RepID=A0AA36MGI9_9DINO|nr:unnamed protein product [Effrenium voratum]CAJ1378392.1 unnamed protein product [Effrenium voratum]